MSDGSPNISVQATLDYAPLLILAQVPGTSDSERYARLTC
jgi:hypothetical protein